MTGWQRLLSETDGMTAEGIKKLATYRFDAYEVYPESVHNLDGTLYFISLHEGKKALFIVGKGSETTDFKGNESQFETRKIKICPLDVANSKILFDLFPFTRPQTRKSQTLTVGLGDRLGLASVGHLQVLKSYDVFPVLAQQSMRELKLTGRGYDEVLASAAWAVFQEGFTRGYGADGDHLKTRQEVQYALENGLTRITLDCSEAIINSVSSLPDPEVDHLYEALPKRDVEHYEEHYLNQPILVKDRLVLNYTPDSLKRMVLLYYQAIQFIISIYHDLIKPLGTSVDYEISIDETLLETSPEAHYFVACELLRASVRFDSLAPKFCGKFEKGIDYRGDRKAFAENLEAHLKIAQKLGYRLSFHSGSDKFSIFPLIGEKTKGCFHLKTAGTYWLEALKIIAEYAPALFRKIYQYSRLHLDEARQYYAISADVTRIPDSDALTDSELPVILQNEHSRQILHITYGLVLMAKKNDGTSIFKDEITSCLNSYSAEYENAVAKHLKKHLDALGVRHI